jgi:hypothetical protein
MYDMLLLFAASRFRNLNHDEVIASRLAEFFAKMKSPRTYYLPRQRRFDTLSALDAMWM